MKFILCRIKLQPELYYKVDNGEIEFQPLAWKFLKRTTGNLTSFRDVMDSGILTFETEIKRWEFTHLLASLYLFEMSCREKVVVERLQVF